MCDRYILVQKAEVIRKRFGILIPGNIRLIPSYNIAPGKYTPVITADQPQVLQLFRFGQMLLTIAGKKILLSHIRVEELKQLQSKEPFQYLIHQQRCLIPADAYIQGTNAQGLSKPFLIYLRNKIRPFAFAGLYDTWLDEETGELIRSFVIITSPANELIQKLPHDRAPVILHRKQEKAWLDTSTPLTEIITMLQPFPAEFMNAYPIAPTIKNPLADDPGLIHPAGSRLEPENRN